MKSLLAFLTLGVFSFHLAAQLSFNVSATLTGVTAPHCVAVADLTGDGMLDLICANGSGANLTIFSNQGNGQFNLTATPPVGNGPPSVIAVDVNGDGYPDLVTANYGSASATVLTNDGTGNFDLAASPAIEASPYSVVAADVNGDGQPDLIFGYYYGGNTIEVLTNAGAGTFALEAAPVVGAYPFSVAAADVNLDGKVDLISANLGSGTLTVLTNNGKGGFVTSATLRVGAQPICVITADVNNDGWPDLISANSTSGSLTVLTNNRVGGFGLSATLTGAGAPYCVAAADLNGDGWPDLISCDFSGDTLTIWTNNANGAFGYSTTLTVGSQPIWVTAADVNGDGEVDLISSDYGSDTLTVLLNATIVTPALPVITFQPASQNGQLGTVANFTVGVAAYPPVNLYQWQLNGTNLPAATNAALIFTNLTFAQSGTYDVVVSNSVGSVMSSNATLTVSIPPVHAALATPLVTNGFVVFINLTDGGYGYTNTPVVRFIGGSGSGASAVATVSNGVVTAINITNPGIGYTNPPKIVVEPPLIPNPVLAITPAPIFVYSNLIVGSNYQLQESVAWYWTNQSASFTATNSIYQQVPPAGAGISGVASYRLTRLPVPAQAFAVAVLDYGFFVAANITSTGSGYVTSPTVAIVGGGGANAGATAQISGGLVTGITVTNPGFGYTNPPSVEIAPPPAVAINPMATLEMRLDSTNLIPYENYQIQFDTGLENSWANLLTFAATAPTNSQYLVVSNNVALFRLEHHQ